jgi:hypothetical protein
MKRFFLITVYLVVSVSISNAQDLFPTDSNGIVEYKAVIESPGTKEDIYRKMKVWVSKTFNNPSDVLKMDDPDAGIIKLKYSIPFIDNNTLFTSLLLEIKENKIRYLFTNIYMPVEPQFQKNTTAEGINTRIKEATDKGKKPMKFLTSYVTVADAQVKTMIMSIQKALNNPDEF